MNTGRADQDWLVYTAAAPTNYLWIHIWTHPWPKQAGTKQCNSLYKLFNANPIKYESIIQFGINVDSKNFKKLARV